MLCASGDTTLLLTRHVRDRGDLTLERAVQELTSRQAEAFGFHDRGVLAEGKAADLVVFALDELHWDDVRLANVMALVFNGLAFLASVFEILAGRATLLVYLVALAAGFFTVAIAAILARRGR